MGLCWFLLVVGTVCGVVEAHSSDPYISNRTASLAIDWTAFLARSDPLWLWNDSNFQAAAPNDHYSSGFVGNGMVGSMLWLNRSDSKLVLDISRTDVYDTRQPNSKYATENFVYDRPRLPIGHFELNFFGLTGSMRICLYDGVVTSVMTDASTNSECSFRLLAHAIYDAMILEYNCTQPVKLNYVSELARSTSNDDKRYVPNPPAIKVQTTDGNTQYQQTLLGGGFFTTSYYQDDIKCDDDSYYLTCTRVSIAISPVMSTLSESISYVLSALSLVRISCFSCVLDVHTSWWHSYYPISFLTMGASRMESFWWIQQYRLASATRQNGTLFDLQGPWFIQGTDWPDTHFDLNLQLTYYPMFTSNKLELATSLIKWLDKTIDNFINNVPQQFRSDSAAAPSGASALDGLETCYWDYGVDCLVTSPTITGNMLWLSHVYWLYYLHQPCALYDPVNRELLLSRFYPFLRRAVNYHSHLFIYWPSDGYYHLPVTFSPEYPYRGYDTNYDLMLYQWGVTTALDIVNKYQIQEPNTEWWTHIKQLLVPFPTDQNGYMIAANVPFNTSHRHFSHLMTIFPLVTIDFKDPAQIKLALISMDHWIGLPDLLTGFARTAMSSMNTMFGRRAAAFSNATYLMDKWIKPNTMYAESGGPCGETPGALSSSISDMFLFTRTGVVRVFPGISDVDTGDASFYHFRGVTGWLVSSVRLNGTTQWIELLMDSREQENYMCKNQPQNTTVQVATDWNADGVKADSDQVQILTIDHDTVQVTIPCTIGSTTGGGVRLYQAGSVWDSPDAVFRVTPNAGTPSQENWWGTQQQQQQQQQKQ